VISPELGISQPGMLITCNDSHTATNGACGALAVPIGGGNQLRHVVARRRQLLLLMDQPQNAEAPVALGASFTFDRLSIDYGFEPYQGKGSGHRVGLRIR